jgi:phage protein D
MANEPTKLISAAPTVRIAGQSLPLLTNSIQRLQVREQVGGLSTLELSLYDVLSFADGSAGWGATASSPLQLGAPIKLYTGVTLAPQEIFDGVITGFESDNGPATAPIFTLLAEDKLWKARRKRRSRTFDPATPADIVRAIAADHGLTPEVRDGLDKPSGSWAMLNESDLGFLRRILERFDADAQVVGDKLQAGPLARDKRTAVTLRQGDNLIRARLTADLADQATAVGVGGWDTASGDAVSATATAGEMGPGRGTDGASVLRAKIGEVRENVGHADALTATEANLVARALYGRRARRFVRVDALAQGNAEIRVGTWVTITGVNPFFANDYCVVEATHRFDQANGYLTDFRAEGAYLGAGA